MTLVSNGFNFTFDAGVSALSMPSSLIHSSAIYRRYSIQTSFTASGTLLLCV